MTLKVLNQSQEFYVDLFNRWLSVPTLTTPEAGMVIQLRNAAKKSIDELDKMRGYIVTSQGLLFNTLVSAVRKARQHGVHVNA